MLGVGWWSQAWLLQNPGVGRVAQCGLAGGGAALVDGWGPSGQGAAGQGVANRCGPRHHAPALAERVAVRRAVELCDILKIEGRQYPRSFRVLTL